MQLWKYIKAAVSNLWRTFVNSWVRQTKLFPTSPSHCSWMQSYQTQKRREGGSGRWRQVQQHSAAQHSTEVHFEKAHIS